MLFIQLTDREATRGEESKNHSYRAAPRLLKFPLKKSARRRRLLPGGGRKERGGQPRITPAAAMLTRLARTIQPK